jgi:hypothetical protein
LDGKPFANGELSMSFVSLEPDVAPLKPEARPVARAAAMVYARHTGRWLIGLMAHGSALKGGYIPGCSDLDLQLYLSDEAFDADGRFPFALGLGIQRELAGIPLGPFQYIQCLALGARRREGWVGPIPGTYHMLYGALPIPEATVADLRDSARQALASLRVVPEYMVDDMLTYGRQRLERHARLLCTEIWPLVFQILTLESANPIAVWRLPKTEAVPLTPETCDVRALAQAFLGAVCAAYEQSFAAERFLALFAAGIAFRHAAVEWYQAWAARNA